MGGEVKIRLHIDQPLPRPAVELGPEQTHYLRHVLRQEPGQAVALFNGRDGEWEARIEAFGRERCTLSVGRQRRAQTAEPDLWLVFAPIKRARLDTAIEKATELGVGTLQPVLTQRTIVERVKPERWRAIAIEAAEQCGRLSVPAILPPLPWARLWEEWPAPRRALVCDPRTDEPIAAALARLGPAGPWAVVTGPEGGFAEAELDAISQLPFVNRVGLGPRVLRADTAGLAAIAILQALTEDRPSMASPPTLPPG